MLNKYDTKKKTGLNKNFKILTYRFKVTIVTVIVTVTVNVIVTVIVIVNSNSSTRGLSGTGKKRFEISHSIVDRNTFLVYYFLIKLSTFIISRMLFKLPCTDHLYKP